MGSIYKGYTFQNLTTQSEDGRFIARVAIMALEGTRTRSQRFLDLETFMTRDEADAHAAAAAMAWIDANLEPEQLALPSRFSPFF